MYTVFDQQDTLGRIAEVTVSRHSLTITTAFVDSDGVHPQINRRVSEDIPESVVRVEW